jgi:hypothetical protein
LKNNKLEEFPPAEAVSFEPPQLELIESPISSELDQFVENAVGIAKQHPEILTAIECDQIAHGLKKKANRLADAEYLKARNPSLPDLEVQPPHPQAATELERGRPRMPPLVVFVLLLLRGWFGGPKSLNFRLILRESITLRQFLQCEGIEVPGTSTVADNVNLVSAQTQRLILGCELQSVLADGLDDFETVRIDSTDAAANSNYPTDSNLIGAFAKRMNRLSKSLKKRGLADLSGHTDARKCSNLVDEIELYAKQIGLLSGKQKVKETRAGLYKKIYSRVDRFLKIYPRLLKRARTLVENAELLPSERSIFEGLVEQAENDCDIIARIREYSAMRVLEDKVPRTDQKVLSISDSDAAMIIKGGRDITFGYRPQLAFSGNGLVCAHVLPLGNAGDSGQLAIVLEEVLANTKISPLIVTVDDGYTNGPVREWFIREHSTDEKPVVFSIAGAKGKRLIDEEDYQSQAYRDARHDRSAAESCIYTLKEMHDYGDIMRRGLEAVRHEQMCKVLAYNIRRIARLKKDAQKALSKQLLEKQKLRFEAAA